MQEGFQEENLPKKQPKELHSLTSPISAVSHEETRILTDYMSKQNLFTIIEHEESLRKPLILKSFFKKRRDQQVVVTSMIGSDEIETTEGKVAAIGRDFVMLTNLQKRIWIPYTAVESATIPFGYPSYSNTHQHFIYDNQLQQKLTLQFGETVAKKESLIQQFFEESIRTNLNSWKGLWVEVKTATETWTGKIAHTSKKELFLTLNKNEVRVPLQSICYVSTIRLFSIWRNLLFKRRNG